MKFNDAAMIQTESQDAPGQISSIVLHWILRQWCEFWALCI